MKRCVSLVQRLNRNLLFGHCYKSNYAIYFVNSSFLHGITSNFSQKNFFSSDSKSNYRKSLKSNSNNQHKIEIDPTTDEDVQKTIETLNQNEQTDRAIDLYYKQKQRNNEFRMNDVVTLSLIRNSIKSKRYSDARQILIDFNGTMKVAYTQDSSSILYDIISSLNSLEQSEELDWFIENLIFTRKYIDKMILDLVMRIYLTDRTNVDDALILFCRIVDRFQRTPWIQVLIQKFTENEDVDGLESILAASIKVHGRTNSFYNMAFAFVECGRINQANKIFVSMNINDDASKIENQIEHFKVRREIRYLYNLLNATDKCIPLHCRLKIFEAILELCAYDNDVEKIEKLFAMMEKENLVPKKNLEKIQTILQKNNIKIPEKWSSSHVQEEENYEKILRNHLNNNQLEEANSLFNELLQNEKPIQRSLLRYILKKNAENGNIRVFNHLRDRFDSSTKSQLKFSTFECEAYIKGGKHQQYIELIRNDSSKESADLRVFVVNLPNHLIDLIIDCPAVYDDFKKLSYEVAVKGFVKPLSIVWIYNFINDKNPTDNNEIWNSQLKNRQTAVCNQISKILFQRNEIAKLRHFLNLDILEKHRLLPLELGKSYSCLFDGLFLEGKYDDIIDELKKALKFISAKHLRPNTLQRIKFGPNDLGQQFRDAIEKAKVNKVAKPVHKHKKN